MSQDREQNGPKEEKTSDIEDETRRLMEQAMKTADSSFEKTPEDSVDKADVPDVAEETIEPVPETPASGKIDETFQRIQARLDDILARIQDSLRSTEPGMEEIVSSTMSRLNNRLKREAGLGVFASKTIKIVEEEVESNLSPQSLLSGVYDTIEESREHVREILTKAGRGTVKNVGRSTGSLQTKVVQLYAQINELEKQLQNSQTIAKRWRSKAESLGEIVKGKEEEILQISANADRLRETQDGLFSQLEERNQEISTLKGEISEANSKIDQLEQLIAKLDAAEELVTDYEAKLVELSKLQGQLAELTEKLSQKESSITSLSNDLAAARSEASEAATKLKAIAKEAADASGMKNTLQAEIDSLKTQIAELRARWDMLYQVAEDEPAFKAYFVVADKTHWFPLTHLSSALGIPTVRLKRQLQKFIDAGLLEIDADRIRPLNLSDVAKKAAGYEEQLIEEAKAEMEKNEGITEDEPSAIENSDTDTDNQPSEE